MHIGGTGIGIFKCRNDVVNAEDQQQDIDRRPNEECNGSRGEQGGVTKGHLRRVDVIDHFYPGEIYKAQVDEEGPKIGYRQQAYIFHDELMSFQWYHGSCGS